MSQKNDNEASPQADVSDSVAESKKQDGAEDRADRGQENRSCSETVPRTCVPTGLLGARAKQ